MRPHFLSLLIAPLFIISAAFGQDAAAHVAAGDANRSKGDFAGAVVEYTAAIELDPKSTAAYMGRAKAKEWIVIMKPLPKFEDLQKTDRSHDYDDAIADYTKAIEIDPALNQAYLGRGLDFAHVLKWREAADDMTRALNVDPTNKRAYVERANCFAALNDYPGALDDITKAIKLDPKDPESYDARGAYWLHQLEFARAIDDVSRQINLEPENPLAHYFRAKYELKNGDFASAIADSTRAIDLEAKRGHGKAFGVDQLDSWASGPLMIRGEAKAASGHLQEGIEDCALAIKASPQNYLAYSTHAKLIADSDWEGALADWNKAIELGPNTAEPYFDRATMRSRLGDFTKAVADYNTAIKHNGLFAKDPLAYAARAEARRGAHDLSGAANDYEEAISMGPKLGVATDFLRMRAVQAENCRQLAFTYSEAGDWKRARATWEKFALARIDLMLGTYNPPLFGSEPQMWVARSKMGEGAAATAELGQLVRKVSKDVPYRWLRDISSYLGGLTSEAKILKLSGQGDAIPMKQASVNYYIGMKRLFAGDRKSAKSYFKRSLAAAPTGWPEKRLVAVELAALSQ